jgi:hypothetical protein
MKNLTHEYQALAILSANTILELVKKAVVAIEPLLGPILVMGQIGVAVVTVVWIWRRAKGAKLENQNLENRNRVAERKLADRHRRKERAFEDSNRETERE